MTLRVLRSPALSAFQKGRNRHTNDTRADSTFARTERCNCSVDDGVTLNIQTGHHEFPSDYFTKVSSMYGTFNRHQSSWQFTETQPATTTVRIHQDTFWKLVTKRRTAEQLRSQFGQVQIDGDKALGSRVLEMVSVDGLER